MTPERMKQRTKSFGLGVLRLVDQLSKTRPADPIARQLLRAGTSVGANYRAACRSRTDGDFLARMGVVEEEADEALYWVELLLEAGLTTAQRTAVLVQEGNETLSMVMASINTVKSRMGKGKGTRAPRPGHVAQTPMNPKSEI